MAAMSAAVRETFLAQVRVAVVVAAVPAEPPLAMPMWYGYPPGGSITLVTSRHSRKAAALRAAAEVGLCVHDDTPPYRYVSVWGPVTEVRESISEAERIAFAARYLGAEGGTRYVAARRDSTADMIAITIRPSRWLTQDQSG
jgi:nitroimidazol reductase NimA-like FMN-containing flavoprotein (pyridoxamine 5'-phosphate oxidase superfamily)